MKLTLETAWKKRLKLKAEGKKLRAEGDKLWAEGKKLYAEGDKLWAEAIIEIKGNIKLEWKYVNNNYECHLETGEVFKPEWEAGLDERI